RESLRQGPNRRPGIVGPIPRRSRWDTLAHGEGAGREARLAVDEARRAVGTRLKRDAKALAESHREHGQAAVIDVLTDQVHAAGRARHAHGTGGGGGGGGGSAERLRERRR